MKAGEEVFLDFYHGKSCFLAKALIAFGPFGCLLQKQKQVENPNQIDHKSLQESFLNLLSKSLFGELFELKLCCISLYHPSTFLYLVFYILLTRNME